MEGLTLPPNTETNTISIIHYKIKCSTTDFKLHLIGNYYSYSPSLISSPLKANTNSFRFEAIST